MSYGVDEEKGRTLLRALLCLIFVCEVAALVATYGAPLGKDIWVYLIIQLLPMAIVLWALHRGSWPGLVVFMAGTLYSIAGVTGMLAGGFASLSELSLLVDFVGMLLRLTVVFCIFRSFTVGRYLQYRRSFRRIRDNVIEVGLFMVSISAHFVVLLLFTNLLINP